MNTICINIGCVPVLDADGQETGEEVVLLRHPGGSVFGVDASYIEQDAGGIRDPFDGKSVLYQENITDPAVLAQLGRTEPYGIVYRWVGWAKGGWSSREVTKAEEMEARIEFDD
jgi:hypothetical protein